MKTFPFSFLLFAILLSILQSCTAEQGQEEIYNVRPGIQEAVDCCHSLYARVDSASSVTLDSVELALLEKSLDTLANIKLTNDSLRINYSKCLRVKANDLQEQQRLTDALPYLKKAEEALEPCSSKNARNHLGDVYSFQSFSFVNTYETDLARACSEKAIACFRETGNKKSEALEESNLAVIYFYAGDERAKLHAEKSLEMYEMHGLDTTSVEYAATLNSTALATRQEALKSTWNGSMKKTASLLRTSIVSFKKLLRLQNQLAKQNPALLGFLYHTYSNIGLTYLDLIKRDSLPGDLDSAIVYMEKAINGYDQFNNPYFNNFKKTMNGSLALAYAYQGKYKKAHKTFLEGMREIGFPLNNIYEAPKTEFLDENKIVFLFPLLFSQTGIIWAEYLATGDVEILKKGLALSIDVLELFDEASYIHHVDYSIASFRMRYPFHCHLAFGMGKELYKLTGDTKYLDECFKVAEKSKSFLLRNAIRNNLYAKTDDEQVKALVLKEKALKNKIRTFQAQVYEDATIRSSLLDAQNAYRLFRDSLKNSTNQTDKSFYYERYDNSIPAISSFQKSFLDDQTAFLEYFNHESGVSCLIVSKNKLDLVELSLYNDWAEDKKLITNFLKVAEGAGKYEEASRRLYNSFFNPVDKWLSKNGEEKIKNLIIIPNRSFRELPLEVLICEKFEENSVPAYLINKYNISYQFSLATYGLLKNSERDVPTWNFASFIGANGGEKAPSYGCSNKPLTNLAIMSKNVATKFPGDKSLIVEPANKEDFLSKGAQSAIVQIVEHGLADGLDPLNHKLCFGGEIEDALTVRELYNQNFGATQLIVLGSCETETGYGKIGEGIESIARGFTYSGCPNIIATLNQVPDEPSAEILENFYRYLMDENRRTDEALSQAKRDYIQEKDPKIALWANLVSIGIPQKFD